MTKAQFKNRWESNANGGGITFDDIAACAISWGLTPFPRTRPMDQIRYSVLKAAETNDYEEFTP